MEESHDALAVNTVIPSPFRSDCVNLEFFGSF